LRVQIYGFRNCFKNENRIKTHGDPFILLKTGENWGDWGEVGRGEPKFYFLSLQRYTKMFNG
jgi:hypothetical protein